jgi:hypothetical protein
MILRPVTSTNVHCLYVTAYWFVGVMVNTSDCLSDAMSSPDSYRDHTNRNRCRRKEILRQNHPSEVRSLFPLITGVAQLVEQ